MMMVLNRNFTLRTTLGHVIGFKKDEPIDVPEPVVDAAMNCGAQAVDPAEVDKRVEDQEKSEQLPPEPQGAEREKIIADAIVKLVKRNHSTDFTAAGSPQTTSVEGVVGFKVSAAERNAAWDRYLDAQNSEKG